MRFIQTHSTGSDETAPYDIVDYEAKTVDEFVPEMLNQCKHSWGEINIMGFGRVEYADGALLKKFPDEWKSLKITKVQGAGGWGRMDYRIFVSPLLE